jgi:hypothetical protein
MSDAPDILFDVATPMGFHVRLTRPYWHVIVTIKHPIMARHEADVQSRKEPLYGTGEGILRSGRKYSDRVV